MRTRILPPALACLVGAAQAGMLSIHVHDQIAGHPLPGVRVSLADGRWTTTDNSGRAHLSDIDAGPVVVTARGIGYSIDSLTVVVDTAGVSTARIDLVESDRNLGTTTIRGQRRGAAEALSRQKSADNTMNVIVADVMGKFPDQNPAEAAARVPGATLARDQGEGRYVSLRGTSPRLTQIRLDGIALPSPEGDIRTPAIDVLPSDQLSAIEVHKSLLPEMDGDGIGGAVDLRTRIAPTSKSRLKGSLGGGYIAEQSTLDNAQGNLTWEARSPDGATGWTLSASGMRRHFGSDNNEAEWGTEELADGSAEAFGLRALELRDYEIVRDRIALSGAVEHLFTPTQRIWTRLAWNRYADDELRQTTAFDLDGDQTAPGVWEDATTEIALKDRYEVQNILLSSIGGEHRFESLGGSQLRWTMNWHFAGENEEDRHDAVFVQEGLTLSGPLSSTDDPKVEVAGGDARDASAYVLDEIVRQDNETWENDVVGSLDWTQPVGIGLGALDFKFGGKASRRVKHRVNDVRVYSWESDDDPPALSAVSAGPSDDDFLGGQYVLGPSIDPQKARDLSRDLEASGAIEVDADESRMESDPGSYRSQELIGAGYGQFRWALGPVVAIAGARWEQSWNEARGNVVTVNEDGDYEGTSSTEVYRVDGRILPRMALRLEPMKDLVFRAAAGRSIARPDHYDLVPYRIVNREDSEVELGNPDLQVTDAVSYDLSVEKYFKGVGMASVGVFHKAIEDQIYTRTFETVVDGDDWTFTQPRNVDESEVTGVEMSWQQQFGFLPSALAGLGAQASWTWVGSEAKILGRTDKLPNPGQASQTARAALSYEWAGFQSRLAWTWQDQILDEVGDIPEEDRWMDVQSHLDLSASQRIVGGWRIWGEVWNLTDDPLRYTWGKNGPFSQQEFYGPTFWLGVKFEG